MRWFCLVLLLVGCGGAGVAPFEPVPAPPAWVEAEGLTEVSLGPEVPDILLVVVDTLRALRALGYVE